MKKVAVVAVHGIGKHLAGETQDAIADLLLSLPARGPYGDPRRYREFRAIELQIPLQPVRVKGGLYVPAKKSWSARFWDLYQEQSEMFAQRAKEAGPPAQPGDPGLHYTERLLRQYAGGADGNVYRTKRLEGQRLQNDTEVHIYEVLWADLAKPNNTVITFFLSLFQLILHLASLSRLAIDSGAGEGQGGLWMLYRTVQRYAVRLLQIFIPLFEILLLIALAACLPEVWSTTRGQVWVPLVLGAAGAVALSILNLRRAKHELVEQPWIWALLALVPAVVGAGLPLLAMLFLHRQAMTMHVRADIAGAVLVWLVPGLGLLLWILGKYEDERKGVLATGIGLFVVSFSIFLFFLVAAFKSHIDDGHVVVLTTLWTAQLLFGAARICWGAMIGCAIGAYVLGRLARFWTRRTRPGDAEWRARAAIRTSRLALALPAVLFFLVTLMIWAGFLGATRKLMPSKDPIFSPDLVTGHIAPPQILPPKLARLDPANWMPRAQHLSLLPPEELTHRNEKYLEKTAEPTRKTSTCIEGCVEPQQNDYALRVLAWSTGYQLPVILALISLAAFLLIWWALPSVLTERVLRRGENAPPRDTTDQVSVRMGTWMSRGLDATSVVTLLLWTSIFLVPPLYHVVLHFNPTIKTYLGPVAFHMVGNTLLGFALLSALAKGGQTVLATILDVDTYLRTSPIRATPRATIFERYISTLRYLRTYRDDQGCGYDSIVIVAHSLGALISGDLLQFLQSDKGREEWYLPNAPGPRFTNIPVTLVTVGNPARQLLNRFFPYLYDWVRSVPDNGQHPLPQASQLLAPPSISDSERPDPSMLGLARWVNAFRSGDYVGRSLWLNEWYHRPAHPASLLPRVAVSPDGTREELCIGAGAHTRYMDDTAPDVAWKLDSLI